MDPDEQAHRLAAESLGVHDPTGWFEQLYEAAERGEAVVPWQRGEPHPLLVEWARERRPPGGGRRALVVGFGPGDDAEFVAGHGFDTVAFDVAHAAVRAAWARFPESRVDYLVADLLDPPAEWRSGFDLVVESLTVQSLPVSWHPTAIANIGRMVAPGGTLLVISAARDPGPVTEPGPPWPLTRAEVGSFATLASETDSSVATLASEAGGSVATLASEAGGSVARLASETDSSAAVAGDGLRAVRIEDLRDSPRPGVRRWRAEFHRPEPVR